MTDGQTDTKKIGKFILFSHVKYEHIQHNELVIEVILIRNQLKTTFI